jgi:hypothetical protein
MFISTHIMIHEEAPAEGVSWDVIPDKFKKLRFDTIDYLYISPFTVLPNSHTFGMSETGTPSQPAGKFTERLKWVIKEARTQKPDIKIIAMQMNQKGNDFQVLTTDELRERYATSVAHLLHTFEKHSLRIDGYDVDYEWNDSNVLGDGNLQSWSPDVLKRVRANLDKLGSTPKFQVSISAASTIGLANNTDLAEVLDYVNMQNYDGGQGLGPKDWIDAIGIPPSKLVWGLSAEGPSKNVHRVKSIDDALKMRAHKWGSGSTAGPLAGVMVWRLNSDNWVFEDMVLLSLYNKVYSKTPYGGLEDVLKKGWATGGRSGSNYLPGFTESDWFAAKQYRA